MGSCERVFRHFEGVDREARCISEGTAGRTSSGTLTVLRDEYDSLKPSNQLRKQGYDEAHREAQLNIEGA